MAKIVYLRTDKNGTKYYANYTCPRCGGAGGSDKLINGLLQAGLVMSAEELEKALLQLLKKNILQSIELSWMRELEREQRLRGLSR